MGQDIMESKSDADVRAEKPRPMVLELSRVSFQGRTETGIRLERADLQVRAGELVTVQIDLATRTRDVASLMQGLLPPIAGDVTFCNEDWLGTDYDRHFAMRSRIGRVFEGQAWIENLNVNENVTLSSRHHGRSPESIQADVGYWVSRLGIDGLSRKRPAFVEPSVLQVHQWIRAFLGTPALVILERPLQFLASNTWLPKLVDAIETLRSRGTAVLWLTSDPVFSGPALEDVVPKSPVTQLSWQDEQLKPVDGGVGDE